MPPSLEKTDHSSLLLRSRAKIAPVLEALAARRQSITVELPEEQGMVNTQLLVADAVGDYIVIAAGVDAALNDVLLALARVTLVAEPQDWHIEFVGVGPGAIEHDGAAAVRLNYPEVLSVQQRRQDERYRRIAPRSMLAASPTPAVSRRSMRTSATSASAASAS